MNALLVFLSDKSLTSSQAIRSFFLLYLAFSTTGDGQKHPQNQKSHIQVHLVVVAIIPVNTEVVADLHYYNLKE